LKENQEIKMNSVNLSEVIERNVFLKLSPLQQRIVSELASGPLTLTELSERTKTSVYSLGKQLSVLQGRTKCCSLQKKGINKPLIKKIKDEGIKTTYFLVHES
jgi:hypothetical protein